MHASPIEVVAFTDEEGARFSFGMIGSRALAGKLSLNDLEHVFKERAAGGPIPDQEWTYTFEEVSEGATRLTRAVEGEPGGFFKLADPLIERALKRLVRADLETLNDLLEAR